MEHIHDRWNPEKAVGVPQIHVNDITWLYYKGFYDGPYSGRVVVRSPGGPFDSNAEILWAQVFEECDELDADDNPICGFYRRFLLYRLSEGSHAEEQRRHALFEKYVGTHWNFTDGKRDSANLRPTSEHHKFYDQAKHWPDWKPEGAVIGWFEI